MLNFAIIIPASMSSKRLPGKPLLLMNGKTMLERTIKMAKRTGAKKVMVVTDNSDVESLCGQLNTTFFRSAREHRSGTSRCAEILTAVNSSIDLIVNWQVDEPFLHFEHVDQLVEEVSSWRPEQRRETIGTIVAPGGADACPHCTYGHRQRSTGSGPCTECCGGHNKHMVKVAVESFGFVHDCHWFSRAPMPEAANHVGVYCYHRDLLRELAKVKPSILGSAENLEQLDWLVAGYKIKAIRIGVAPRAINTFHDYEMVLKGCSR